MKFLDKIIIQSVDSEVQKIAPQVVQNEYGTKIIDNKELRIYRHIAHLRLLNKMAAHIFIMEALIIVFLLMKGFKS